MTAAGGGEGRDGAIPTESGPRAGNFRALARAAFRTALARLVADGVAPIAADELPALLEQVRETADPKFGDYSGTMAMALAKKAGRKPRDMADEIIRRLDRSTPSAFSTGSAS
ncbi:MAG: hypothetical protein ACKOTB_06835 [Planctomycetia bacterium]